MNSKNYIRGNLPHGSESKQSMPISNTTSSLVCMPFLTLSYLINLNMKSADPTKGPGDDRFPLSNVISFNSDLVQLLRPQEDDKRSSAS
jgi:hypothetical protein